MNVIIVQTAFLGDVLLTLPLCVAVKKILPQAHISLVTTPAAADMVRGVASVDSVVVFDKRGKHRTLAQQSQLARSLRSSEKTILLVAHKSWRTALFVREIGADVSIAFRDSPSRWFCTSSVRTPSGLHAAERYLLLLKPLADKHTPLPSLDQCVPMTFTAEATSACEDASKPHVVLAPGSVWPTKQWPAEHFRALAQRMVHEGMRVSVIGDASVADVGNGLDGVDNLAGKTSMRKAADIVSQATILVANDSAPVHLASLQNVPVIAIFGPTIPEFGFGPFGTHAVVVQRQNMQCRPCSDHGTVACPLGTHECMKSITVDMVYDQIQQLLQRSR